MKIEEVKFLFDDLNCKRNAIKINKIGSTIFITISGCRPYEFSSSLFLPSFKFLVRNFT